MKPRINNENVSVNASSRFKSVSELLGNAQAKTSPAIATERPREQTPSGASLCEYEGRSEHQAQTSVHKPTLQLVKGQEACGVAAQHLELATEELINRRDNETAQLASRIQHLRRSQDVPPTPYLAGHAPREQRPQKQSRRYPRHIRTPYSLHLLDNRA